MFCLRCGTNLPDDASFCLRCGSPTDSEATRVSSKPINTSFQQVQSKPKFTIGIAGALAIAFFTLLMGAGAIIFSEWYRQQREAERAEVTAPTPSRKAEVVPTPKSTPDPTPQPTPLPTPQPRVRIVPASFSVPAGNYHATQFYVREGGHVVGWYQVNRYDIFAVIVKEDGLICFQSRGQNCSDARTYYTSGGKVSSGQIDVRLTTGTYYIVFANQHASFFSKDVRTDIYLEE